MPNTVRRVHRHLPRGVEGVHHRLPDVVGGLHGHVGEVVHHVRHVEHAHDVVVGGGVGVAGAEAGVGVRAGGVTGTVRAAGSCLVHLPPDHVPGLPVVTDVEPHVELS